MGSFGRVEGGGGVLDLGWDGIMILVVAVVMNGEGDEGGILDWIRLERAANLPMLGDIPYE